MATKKTKTPEVEEVEVTEEVIAVKPVKAAPRKLYFYADCQVGDYEYKAGDEFSPPANWSRVSAQEELLLATKQKSGARAGVVFTYLGEVVNPGEKNPELRERRVHNVILPLEVR